MIEQRSVESCLDKPPHITGSYGDYTNQDIAWIAQQFALPDITSNKPFPDRGNINLHTYLVKASGREYLLQKVNSAVFTMPHRVMNSMIASLTAQRESLNNQTDKSLWEPIELIATRTGHPFLDLSDEHGLSVWRMMVRIAESRCYKSLSEVPERSEQLRLAREVGRGLAIYSDLTSSIDSSTVQGSLPGYRDTALYYRQFHSILERNRTLEAAEQWLPKDPIVRDSTENHFVLALADSDFESRLHDPELIPFVELLERQEPLALGLWSAIERGEIRKTLIHGDTKIENFLFCARTGRVKSLVDLDTIMPFTWLADWGDMIRSLVNVAGERERDVSRVGVDREVYAAVARGFLETARQVTDGEVKLMVAAVQSITLELGLRFLTDYLRGDSYFRLGDADLPDLNKVRAIVQLTLYRRLADFEPDAEELIAGLRPRSR